MKRTALQRRTTIQRQRMRRKCREPRTQSRTFREEYKAVNPEDEFWTWLKIPVPIAGDMRDQMPPELNHIFVSRRVDTLCNVITLSKARHDWHHKNLNAGRVLCCLVKVLKQEADLKLWGQLAGSRDKPRPILSWVESLRFDGELAWVTVYQQDLIRRLTLLEAAA